MIYPETVDILVICWNPLSSQDMVIATLASTQQYESPMYLLQSPEACVNMVINLTDQSKIRGCLKCPYCFCVARLMVL